MRIIFLAFAISIAGCSGQAKRAEPGTASISHKTYDENGNLQSSTDIEVVNDEDSKNGFGVSMNEKEVNVDSSGSKDAVFDESNKFLWFIGIGSILIVTGTASLISKSFGNIVPGLSLIPRGPSWIMIFAGIGLVCAQWMSLVVALFTVVGVCVAGYLLSVQHNVQVHRKNQGELKAASNLKG